MIYEIVIDNRQNMNKFEDGTLRADGCTKRYEAHGSEIPVGEFMASKLEEAKEGKFLNSIHNMVKRFGNVSETLLKTPEVRRAELDALLCG